MLRALAGEGREPSVARSKPGLILPKKWLFIEIFKPIINLFEYGLTKMNIYI